MKRDQRSLQNESEAPLLVERTVGGVHEYLIEKVRVHGIGKSTTVLDIGCGSGAWLARLKREGLTRLVGIDQSAPHPVDGLELKQFDVCLLDPAPLGKFELVTCIEVIEHVENIGLLLDAIRGALLPGGFAIITTPNIESLRARVRALVSGRVPQFDEKGDLTHLMPVLRASLEKMLRKRQMCIIQSLQYPQARHQTRMFSAPVRILTWFLSLFIRDPLYGDTAIYLLKHQDNPSSP